jgi:hypothetical protein
MTETKDGIWFSIHIEEDEFVAFITAEALRTGFKTRTRVSSKLGSTYQKNQQVINALAKRKFLSGAARPIQVTAADLLHKHADI